MLYIENAFPLSRDIVIFVDGTQFGHLTLTSVLEISLKVGRKVHGLKIISNSSTPEQLSSMLADISKIVIVDCSSKIITKLLDLCKEQGLTGFRFSVTWLFTQRTMDSLPLLYSLPEGSYIGVKPQFRTTNASSFISNVLDKCYNSSAKTSSECARARNR